MRLCVFIVLVTFSVTFSFHQTDYHVIAERVNLAFYNKSYFSNIKFVVYYFTRFSKKLNISFDLIQDLNANLMTLHLEGKKWQSNEYRLFPFNYSENVCISLYSNKFGNNLSKFDTNFPLNCFIKSGYLYFKNIQYDDSQFPPYAPRGRFLIIAKILYKKIILLNSIEVCLEIKAQNPLERTIGV